MQCDVCKKEIWRKRDGVVLYAVTSKGSASKLPAGWVHLAHRRGCQDTFEDLVFKGIIRVNYQLAAPLVEPISAFDGTGEKLVRLRRLYAFEWTDLQRLRACDAWAGSEEGPFHGGTWQRFKDFVLGAFSP